MFKRLCNLYMLKKTKNLTRIPLFTMTFNYRKYKADARSILVSFAYLLQPMQSGHEPGHVCFIEKQRVFNRIVLDFISCNVANTRIADSKEKIVKKPCKIKDFRIE